MCVCMHGIQPVYLSCVHFLPEACRLKPCIIEVEHKNRVFMVKKEPARIARSRLLSVQQCSYWLIILCTCSIGYNSSHERIKMSVSKVSEQDYEKMQYDVYALQKACK